MTIICDTFFGGAFGGAGGQLGLSKLEGRKELADTGKSSSMWSVPTFSFVWPF